MICPITYAALMPIRDYTVDTCKDLAVCLGAKCALWLPEINGTPARPTGRGNCAHNPKAPARKPEE